MNILASNNLFQIANLHLDPALGNDEKKEVLSELKKNLVKIDEGIAILTDDFNFMPVGEHRLDLTNGEPIIVREPIASYFEAFFDYFVEVAQDQFTRVRIEQDKPISASRLDRMYINMQPMDLMDMQPRAIVLHNALKSDRLSDHAALSIT